MDIILINVWLGQVSEAILCQVRLMQGKRGNIKLRLVRPGE